MLIEGQHSRSIPTAYSRSRAAIALCRLQADGQHAPLTRAAANNWPNPANPNNNYKNCINNFYNSAAGTAVQFGSPLALLPGWNPKWGSNLEEWGIAIFGKLGGLFGSGAMSGTTQITTLSGTTTVGSTLELGTEAVLGTVEKAATPAMALSTYGDIAAHMNCVGGPAANTYLYQGALMGGGN